MSGGQDVCMPPQRMQALADQLPDARHARLEGVGHWPQLESPDAFEGLLLDFLATQRATVH
ncbi:alpha/beta fold hydrolase [Comamonas sp. JC664]|uniref:alpha/beta fold hydrolase n=1 Tax=Comamonas sp. JC664 TaxID=2801917 RepID=UPI00361E717B